jgi:solute carrier family 35 protein F1/2
MAFTCAMVILYTVAPILYRLASAAFFNLSLLSSDFYGLLFGQHCLSGEMYMYLTYASRIVPLCVYQTLLLDEEQ